VLGARIHAAEVAKRQQAEASTRRNLLGSGDRSDRNRTYNFPQGRVTDHRYHGGHKEHSQMRGFF
jgi:peptide chain release factor 1